MQKYLYFATIFLLINNPTNVLAETTPILIGGEGTELSSEGVLTGNGSFAMGGLGAAVLDTFIIYYQPNGEGDWVDNVFPDPEVYSFQMDLVDGLPDYQSRGRHGDFWDSRGRNGDGILPWINRDWRGGQYYDHQYLRAGEDSPFGLVSNEVQWTLNYWDGDENNRFVHTCLTGMGENFIYDEDTGNATALLLVFQSAYVGYQENGEPGPGHVEFVGGAYQGFDSFREPSGRFSHPAFFFSYDGETNTGSLTPCGTMIQRRGEGGWGMGYYNCIQAAIDSAADGDSLILQPGEYYENINFNGKSLAIGSLFMTTGDVGHIGMTIIDGDSSGTVVTFANGEDENAQLVGVTVRNGYTDTVGGGINCANSSPVIRDCFIMSNYARTRGGGIACEPNANPIIENCEIIGNSAGSGGGGIWCGDLSHPTIRNCLIADNRAGWNGGGINMYQSCRPLINDCIIRNNQAEHKGGGIIVSQDCSPTFDNCRIEFNTSVDNGGGMTVERNAQPTFQRCIMHRNSTEGKGGSFAATEVSAPRFINCVMSWNTAFVDGGSIYIADAHPVLVNTIHYVENFPATAIFDPDSAASSITVAYSDFEGGEESIVTNDNGEVNWLEHNIDEEPRFVNPDDGVFNLHAGSPCVDAGTSFFVWNDDTLVNFTEDDYLGNAPDLGAIESEFTGIGDRLPIKPDDFSILTAYPNPFNSTVRIVFDLPVRSPVSLAVFDLYGRELYNRTMGSLNPGRHDFIWNTDGVPNGIYIAAISNGKQTLHTKLLHVK